MPPFPSLSSPPQPCPPPLTALPCRYAVCALLVLSLLMCAYVGWCFRRQRFPYVWPVWVLRVGVSMVFQVWSRECGGVKGHWRGGGGPTSRIHDALTIQVQLLHLLPRHASATNDSNPASVIHAILMRVWGPHPLPVPSPPRPISSPLLPVQSPPLSSPLLPVPSPPLPSPHRPLSSPSPLLSFLPPSPPRPLSSHSSPPFISPADSLSTFPARGCCFPTWIVTSSHPTPT